VSHQEKRIRNKRKAERRINGPGKKVGPAAYSAVWAEKKKRKRMADRFKRKGR
jgi:hypothetical protein